MLLTVTGLKDAINQCLAVLDMALHITAGLGITDGLASIMCVTTARISPILFLNFQR